ncbi:MAG TPA: Bax inhibitor-1/YccA family protein [Vicinamibacteria bacterium]|jgi:uncharacterized YccA/Bax inhibitor family protein
MFKSGNPALRADTFSSVPRVAGEAAMTLPGTVNKTGISLLILLLFAAFTWGQVGTPFASLAMIGGLILGLVCALVIAFKKVWAPFLTPVYAACQGLALGGISAIYEAQFPGIVINAVALTFGTLGALLLAYKSGLIRATENFKLGIFAATGAIGLIYLVSFVLRLFGKNIPYIHDSGLIGIGFSLFVVTIAALNLVLDFDFIERGSTLGAPKYMEWVGAFGLLVTLVWLYLEFLRLLAKLNSRKS